MTRLAGGATAILIALLLASDASPQNAQARAHVHATVAPTALPAPISEPTVVTGLRSGGAASTGSEEAIEYRTRLALPAGTRFDVSVDRSGGDGSIRIAVANQAGRFQPLSERDAVAVPAEGLATGRAEVRYRVEGSDDASAPSAAPAASRDGSPPAPVVVTLVIARN